MIARQHEMSKSQLKIANYLIDHQETAPFLTASKLAKNAEVGEATVVRFAFFLDYKAIRICNATCKLHCNGNGHLQKYLRQRRSEAILQKIQFGKCSLMI
ncbi:MurR/RpiR family transcriptional regulator [Geomicrobium sp. JCM 19055]|uniref:MurR/RpiR family transcriptional regulator n=1 Tax=Geomicrobium sp. JCM 19055 TaxID=1460649 RepID=UPI00351C2CD4